MAIACANAAEPALPRSRYQGSANRQVARQQIADPTPRSSAESTSNPGDLATWRFAIVAFSGSRPLQIPHEIALPTHEPRADDHFQVIVPCTGYIFLLCFRL
jgi:hypothetical protein